MRGDLLISHPSEFEEISRRVQGDISIHLSPDIDLPATIPSILNFLWVRTWLYPLNQIYIQSSPLSLDFLFVQYGSGILIFSSNVASTDVLFSRVWTPFIEDLVFEITPASLPEVQRYFPGARVTTAS